MSPKKNTGVEEPNKKMEKTKGEEAITAWSTETDEAKPETCRFKPKPGSVIPKKRRLVQSMMLDYALLKLTGSPSSSTEFSTTAETKRVYPHSPNHAD